MTTPKPDSLTVRIDGLRRWLDRPLSNFWCVASWLGATAVFIGLATLLGGPTEGDAAESIYSTWSIAHGNLACAYPPTGVYHLNELASPFALAPPLYPLISGAAAAILRIGHAVAFPTSDQLGRQCIHAYTTLFKWSVKSGAILSTVHLGYLAWPALLAGVVALLRASGRGRRGWEPFALLVVACTAPALTCLTYYFHPQDLLAMGLILGGVACSFKNRWLWAGVLLGLAFCSQQFALLVGAPLIIVAPAGRRLRYATGALIAGVLIDVPMIVSTSGRAAKIILLGSSRVGSNIRSTGGTLLWELDLRGPLLFLLARVLPVVASLALAWWASRRLGERLLRPIPLISFIATSLAIRLVFEENLFGYYFMAAAVSLVVLDVAVGRIRGSFIAWLALVTLAFNPAKLGFTSNLTSWSEQLYYAIPVLLVALATVSLVVYAVQRRVKLYKIVWLVLVSLTCELKIWGLTHSIFIVPNWLWQVILVPTALVLSLSPLMRAINEGVSDEYVAAN